MIKISIIVLSGLAVARLLRTQSAATRHWVLSLAIACSAATPVLESIVPAWSVGSPISSSAAQISDQGETVLVREASAEPWAAAHGPSRQLSERIRRSTAGELLGVVWMIGTGLSLFVLVVGLGRLEWLASRSERLQHGRWPALAEELAGHYGLRRSVVLLRSDHPTLLVTWGVLRPKVIVPASARGWPEDRVRVVLCHELAHIRRGDWVVQMTAELLRAVYWFNPLLWIANGRLREESERACDDAVLNLGVGGPEYASHLLDLARALRAGRRHLPEYPAPAMARPSSLERRVGAMLNTRLNRSPVRPSIRIVTMIALLTMTVSIAGFGAAAQAVGTFSGSVVDPMNSVIPKVTLVLTHAQTQAKHAVRSDEAGYFEFAGLPPGEYRLEVVFPGFATLVGTVTVVGQNVQRNLVLQVGSLEETVTVRAGSSSQPHGSEQSRVQLHRGLQECRTSSTGGNIRPPRKLRDARPVYPPHLQGRVQGIVVLNARIGTDGFLQEVKVLESANADLANAAVEAVRQWQFDATLLNCVPIEVAIKVTVNFEAE